MEYITQEEAAKQLGVTRASVNYYMKALKLKGHRFPLDRRVYLSREDFEKLAAIKKEQELRTRKHEESLI